VIFSCKPPRAPDDQWAKTGLKAEACSEKTDVGVGCIERGGVPGERFELAYRPHRMLSLGLEARLNGGLTIKCVLEDDVLPVCA